MKHKEIGPHLRKGAVAPAPGTARDHKLEHPRSTAVHNPITVNGIRAGFLQLRAAQEDPQAPRVREQTIQVISQQGCSALAHTDGLKQTIAIGKPSITSGQAIVVSPVELKHVRLALVTAENQGAIGAAKTEGIGQGHPHIRFPGLMRHEIQITPFIRIVQINGRRQHTVSNGQN